MDQTASLEQHASSSVVFVGIDVAKKHLDIHIRPAADAFTVSRDGPGLDELVHRLQVLQPE